jgi:hypothetical protein
MILFTSFCKRQAEKAMEYNNEIAKEIKYLTDLESEIDMKDGPELLLVIEKFKQAVPEAKSRIDKLGKFEDDDSLQRSALAICNFYEEIIAQKWKEKSLEVIKAKSDELDNDLQKKQADFATKYKFEIKK